MAGRRPKTSAERALGGNAGHRALPNDPKPALGRPRKPRGLGTVGRREWRRLAGILEGEHRLTVSDGPALEAAARAYEAWLAAIEEAADCSLTIDTAQGIRVHPAHAAVRQASDLYRKWLNDLTITPGTRARARVPDDGYKKQNVLQQLQAQGRQLRAVS